MDATYIFLYSLQQGYDHIEDIRSIFEACVKYHKLNKKYKECYYTNTLLHQLLDKNYIDRRQRGFYNITYEGSKYLNTLQPLEKYHDTITSTVKQLDSLVQSLVKNMNTVKSDIETKYFTSDFHLIDELNSELNCKYIAYISDNKLKIITLEPFTMKEGTLLSSPDIEICQGTTYNC